MKVRVLLLIAALATLSACDLAGPQSPSGFRLPDGNAEDGRRAFVQLRCIVCHQAEGIDAKFEGTPAATVRLGGDTLRVKSYGELVTAIINPSHRIAPGTDLSVVAPEGKSLMEAARLNDVMTVRQLVDLVAFLQPLYRVLPPSPYPYGYIYP